MTTTEPSLAQKIYAAAKSKNAHSVDAPVSGGDVGAREARLSIMVGGRITSYNVCYTKLLRSYLQKTRL